MAAEGARSHLPVDTSSGYPDAMGRGRSRWQDGRRAWARLNAWHLRPLQGYPNEVEGPVKTGQAAASALKDVAFVRHLLDDMELKLVKVARAGGVSWAEIATPLAPTPASQKLQKS